MIYYNNKTFHKQTDKKWGNYICKMNKQLQNMIEIRKKILSIWTTLLKKYFHQYLGIDKDHQLNNTKQNKWIHCLSKIALESFSRSKWNFFQLNQHTKNTLHLSKAQIMITQQKLMMMNNLFWIKRNLKITIYWITNNINWKTKIKCIHFKAIKIWMNCNKNLDKWKWASLIWKHPMTERYKESLMKSHLDS